MRRLGRDRRDASTRLPLLSRTGPLARKPASVAAVGAATASNDSKKRPGEPR
jgi:hypothetical protein